MASQNFSKNKNNTKCDVVLYFNQTATGASFYFTYKGYRNAKWIPQTDKVAGHYSYLGNSAGYIRMDVDGTYTGGPYKYAGAVSYDTHASGSGWIQDQSGTSNTLNLPAKNTAYNVTIRWTGNFSDTATKAVTYSFTIPIYVNPDGTIKPIQKAYANVGGVIKECAVFVNVNGTIKQLK